MEALKQRVLSALTHGSVEELATTLSLIFRLSFPPSNTTTAVDVSKTDRGRCKFNEEAKLD